MSQPTTGTPPTASQGENATQAAVQPVTVRPGEPAAIPAHVHPVTVTVRVRLKALAIQEADGRYSVIVPALPGCVTQGDDIEEVQANIVEAAEGWLEVGHDQGKDEALRMMLE